jgi:hypothetical protein
MVIQEKLECDNFVMLIFLMLIFGFDCDNCKICMHVYKRGLILFHKNRK